MNEIKKQGHTKKGRNERGINKHNKKTNKPKIRRKE